MTEQTLRYFTGAHPLTTLLGGVVALGIAIWLVAVVAYCGGVIRIAPAPAQSRQPCPTLAVAACVAALLSATDEGTK